MWTGITGFTLQYNPLFHNPFSYPRKQAHDCGLSGSHDSPCNLTLYSTWFTLQFDPSLFHNPFSYPRKQAHDCGLRSQNSPCNLTPYSIILLATQGSKHMIMDWDHRIHPAIWPLIPQKQNKNLILIADWDHIIDPSTYDPLSYKLSTEGYNTYCELRSHHSPCCIPPYFLTQVPLPNYKPCLQQICPQRLT